MKRQDEASVPGFVLAILTIVVIAAVLTVVAMHEYQTPRGSDEPAENATETPEPTPQTDTPHGTENDQIFCDEPGGFSCEPGMEMSNGTTYPPGNGTNDSENTTESG